MTYAVTDSSGEYAGRNLDATDAAFREAVRREGGAWLDAPLQALGDAFGSRHVPGLGSLANRFPPELVAFDPVPVHPSPARWRPV